MPVLLMVFHKLARTRTVDARPIAIITANKDSSGYLTS